MQEVRIGRRFLLSTDGCRGVIRYFGPLKHARDADGDWVGVEWDDSTRGSHGGTVNGVTYFECGDNKSGSLLKVNKFLDAVSWGEDLLSAVRRRYVSPLTEDEVKSMEVVDCKSGRTKPMEFVGYDKIQRHFERLDKLATLCLSHETVASLGNAEELMLVGLGGGVLSLYVDDCFLSSWTEVGRLLLHLPSLILLDLSGNFGLAAEKGKEPPNFSEFLRMAETGKPAFNGLEALHVSRVGLQWKTAQLLAGAFPHLKVLGFARNPLVASGLDGNDEENQRRFEFVEELTLDDCELDKWTQVKKILSTFPCLKRLQLSGNRLGEDTREGSITDALAGSGLRLEGLILDTNNLSQWHHLGELCRAFRNLRTFRWMGCPLQQNAEGQAPPTLGAAQFTRLFTMALLPQLQVLNGTEVTKDERTQAERYFLSAFGREVPAALAIDPKGEEKTRLHEKHGPVIEASAAYNKEGSTTATLLSSGSVVSVRLQPDVSSAKSCVSVEKNLPLSMKLRDLKGVCSRHFSVPIDRLRLVYITRAAVHGVVWSDEDSTLGLLGISEGGLIKVQDTKDVEEMGGEDER